MLYVSDVKDIKTAIGVVDTDDNVKEYISNRKLAKIVHDMKVVVYGTSYYNYEVECTPLKLNQQLDISVLMKLLKAWRFPHNCWTGYPVRDYLATLKVGTSFQVDYKDTDTAGNTFRGHQTFKKVDLDAWLIADKDIIGCDGVTNYNSKMAAGYLESSCIYCTVTRIY